MPAGKSLAYISIDGEDENNTLWLQSFDEETPRRIANLGDEPINCFALSPDGKQFALVRGTWNHDAVLIKGFK